MIVSFDDFLNESYKNDKMKKMLGEFYDFAEKVNKILEDEGFTVILNQYGKNLKVSIGRNIFNFIIGMFDESSLEAKINQHDENFNAFTRLIESLPSFRLSFWRKKSVQSSYWMEIEWSRKDYKFVPSAIKIDMEKFVPDNAKGNMKAFNYVEDGETEKKFLSAQFVIADEEKHAASRIMASPSELLSHAKDFMEDFNMYKDQCQSQIETIESLVHKVPAFDFSDMSTMIKTSRFGI
jgi:hypothetical protein